MFQCIAWRIFAALASLLVLTRLKTEDDNCGRHEKKDTLR
jgi:hypothetical protein